MQPAANVRIISLEESPFETSIHSEPGCQYRFHHIDQYPLTKSLHTTPMARCCVSPPTPHLPLAPARFKTPLERKINLCHSTLRCPPTIHRSVRRNCATSSAWRHSGSCNACNVFKERLQVLLLQQRASAHSCPRSQGRRRGRVRGLNIQ